MSFMIPPFDLFQVMQDTQPLWLEPASTLDDARAGVNELRKSNPGEYLIISQKIGHKISIMIARLEKPGS
jgi:hypothetical protein